MQEIRTNKTFDDFHDWIRALRIGLKRFETLFDKLSIYEHKFVTGPGSSLDQASRNKAVNFNPFLHWIVKIDETKEELGELYYLVKQYEQFLLIINEQEKMVLSNLITCQVSMSLLTANMNISRTHLYKIRNDLFKKWVIFMIPSHTHK